MNQFLFKSRTVLFYNIKMSLDIDTVEINSDRINVMYPINYEFQTKFSLSMSFYTYAAVKYEI